MTVQTNNAESTAGAGATVTTANQTGGISAGGAYNTVTGAITYDSTSPFDGSLCYSPAVVTGVSYILQRSSLSVTTFRKRFYFKIDATPTALVQFLSVRNASGAAMTVRWNTNNTIQFVDSGGSTILTTGTLSTGVWYGIDMVLTPNSTTTTGAANIAVYDNTGATVSSITSTTRNLGGATSPTITIFQMTRPAIADTTPVHFDTDTWDDASTITTLFGPASSPVTGTATFTGTGTLAVTGTPTTTGTQAFTGTGTLGVTGTLATTGPVTLAGNGTLATTGTPATNGTAALSGSGTLNAAGAPTPNGSIGLSGTGTLAVTGAPSFTGNIAVGGTGTLGVAAGGYSGTATFTGNGTLTIAGVPRVTGTVTLNGSGTLTQNGAPNIAGAATYAGTGTLNIQGAPRINGTAAFTGVGVLLVINSSTLRDITLTALPLAQRFTTLSLPDRLTGTRLPDRIASQSLNSRITTNPLPDRFITTPEVS